MPTLNILVCGSREQYWRENRSAAYAYTQSVVNKAMAAGHHILVGDATGVDAWVCEICILHTYNNVSVFTPHEQPRNGGVPGTFVIRDRLVTTSSAGIVPLKDYTDRDRYMAEIAQVVIGVWNGTSRGTPAVCNYAENLPSCQTVKLMTFPQQQQNMRQEQLF